MTNKLLRTAWRMLSIFCVAVVCLEVVFNHLIYLAFLNAVGPSTEFHDPTIVGAAKQPNGKYVAYVDDGIHVIYRVVRHKKNGDCLLYVWRYAEAIGGPKSGKRRLVNYVELRFKGADETLYPRWPQPNDLKLDKSWLSPGVNEQEYALYVVARYDCNVMDRVIPRYLQGGLKPNESQRANLIVRRNKL